MSVRKTLQSFANLEKAVERLEEDLNEGAKNSLFIDGAIQRFEFTFELYWKTLKLMLEEEGIEAKTPRETLKQAYAVDWIQNEQSWLRMLRDRNETSRIYDQEKARHIYENIVGYFPEMKETFKLLKAKYKEGGSEFLQ